LVPAGLFRRWHSARLRGQRGVSHRLDRAELGRDLGRSRSRPRAARDGIRVPISCQTRRRHVAVAHAAFRSQCTQSRVHQRLPARCARERRPVHACSRVVRHRVRTSRRRRSSRRALFYVESDQSRSDARGRASLQGRALCCRRRHLQRAATHRPWWLDLVHRCGGVDVSSRHRIPARLPVARRSLRDRPLRSAQLVGFQSTLPQRYDSLSRTGGQPTRGFSRHSEA
jgi:hypothetical protein